MLASDPVVASAAPGRARAGLEKVVPLLIKGIFDKDWEVYKGFFLGFRKLQRA
jgi:hypothetical protein